MWSRSRSRSRAKVTAPALAKYPGSGRLRLRNPGVNAKHRGKELEECNITIEANVSHTIINLFHSGFCPLTRQEVLVINKYKYL